MFKLIKLFFEKNLFLKNASLLMGGTGVAQIIILLASPIITRLYEPSVFGEFSAYVGVISVFVVISTLRYHLAIPIASTDKEALHLATISLLSLIFITLFTTLLILLTPLEGYFQTIVENKTAIWLIPVGVFFVGLYQVANYWAIRRKIFKDIASTRVIQSTLLVLIQVSAAGFGVLALIIGQIIGQTAGVYRLFKKGNIFEGYSCVNKIELIKVAKKYKKFPLLESWSSLLNTAGYHLPVLFLAFFFSSTSAGLYALANQVLSIPVSLLGEAVGKVFMSGVSDKFKSGKANDYIYEIISNLAKIFAPLFVIFAVFASDLFGFIFGSSWEGAGGYATIMSPWLYIVFIVSPIASSLFLVNKQEYTLYFQICLLFFRVLSISIGVHFESVILAIVLYSASSAIVWVGYLLSICRVFHIELKRTLIVTIRPILISGFVFIPFLLNKYANGSQYLTYISIIVVILYMCIYYNKLLKKIYLVLNS